MRRREFITILAGTATWPIVGSAQQAQRIRRIEVLMASAENNAQYQTYMAAFRDTFHNLGWAEGRTIQIDYRWAALQQAIDVSAARPSHQAEKSRINGIIVGQFSTESGQLGH
jgi:hypothetical protein